MFDWLGRGFSKDKMLVTRQGPLTQKTLLYNANQHSRFFFLKDPKSSQHLRLPEKTKDYSFLSEAITLKYVPPKKSALRQLEGSHGAGCATTHKGQQKLILKIRAEAGTQNNIYAIIHIFSSAQSSVMETEKILESEMLQSFPSNKNLRGGESHQSSSWASTCKYSNTYPCSMQQNDHL